MKTMLEVAYETLKNVKDMDFDSLWEVVNKKASVLEGFETWSKKSQLDKKAEFYKLLILDGRFIRATSNEWTLVENQTFEALQKMKGFYASEEIKD